MKISLAACKDGQLSWESSTGESMTQVQCYALNISHLANSIAYQILVRVLSEFTVITTKIYYQ